MPRTDSCQKFIFFNCTLLQNLTVFVGSVSGPLLICVAIVWMICHSTSFVLNRINVFAKIRFIFKINFEEMDQNKLECFLPSLIFVCNAGAHLWRVLYNHLRQLLGLWKPTLDGILAWIFLGRNTLAYCSKKGYEENSFLYAKYFTEVKFTETKFIKFTPLVGNQ